MKLGVLFLLSSLFSSFVVAKDINFTASVDTTALSEDESVSLKLKIEAEGNLGAGVNPQFDAPDFDLVNSYNQSGMSSSYSSDGSGKPQIRTVFTQTINQILRPKKTGDLEIKNIRININGKTYNAPTIKIAVTAGGQGTPLPGKYGSGTGLKAGQNRAKQFFVKAEISKPSIYKGEQLVVSYYLYRQVQVFNLEVVKYPLLNGFLREDLELPILRRRLSKETVVLNGLAYERSLLIRYAAYPLKSGELKIDPMGIKLSYYARDDRNNRRNDPFASFFRDLNPKTGRATSEPVKVQVKDLPVAGRPESYTGGVGNFDVSSVVDKYSVRANEAVNLTLKIEGKGNVAGIGEPHVPLGSDIELFDSTENSKTAPGGVGQKTFEFSLIPRKEGQTVIPGIEISFFDPQSETYLTKKTEPIELRVLPGVAGSAPPPKRLTRVDPGEGQGVHQSSPEKAEIRYLRPPGGVSSTLLGQSWGSRLLWFDLGLFVLLGLWIASDQTGFKFRNLMGSEDSLKRFEKVRAQQWKVIRAGTDREEVNKTYQRVALQLQKDAEQIFSLSDRSLSREDLLKVLKEDKRVPEKSCDQLRSFFEYADTLQYSGSDEQSKVEAKRDLASWISQCEGVVKSMEKISRGETPPA